MKRTMSAIIIMIKRNININIHTNRHRNDHTTWGHKYTNIPEWKKNGS